MTEQEWLTSSDPAAMLRAVTDADAGDHPDRTIYGAAPRRASDRKLRLFVEECYGGDIVVISVSDWLLSHREGKRSQDVNRRQAALLRDIVGNPFRPVTFPTETCSCSMYGRNGWVVGDRGKWEKCDRCKGTGKMLAAPAWLRWNGGAIPALAQRIYDERAFDLMPMLGDMLEDAGCDNEELMRHCRGDERFIVIERPKATLWGYRPLSGPHARGCWVLDLLTGKE